MGKVNETLGYARGLLKAMESSCEDKNLLELLNAMVGAMEDQSANIRKLDEQFSELDEYVESIDDDLADLEDMVDTLDEHDFDDEDDDFPFDEDDDDMDFDEVDEDDERPLRLVKHKHNCKCGHHHHDEDHECHCHDDEDDGCDCDDEDEELDLDGFDNLFLGVMCPECNRLFCVTDADFDDPEALYHCPYCEKDVHISPIEPDSVPVAKRVK